MQASVSIGLGSGDIILLGDQRHIVPGEKGIGDKIDVVHVRTDHPYPGHIMDVCFYAFEGKRQMPPFEFVQNAGCPLQPGADRTDGIALVAYFEFRIQHFKFGSDFLHGAGIGHHEFFVAHNRADHQFGLLQHSVQGRICKRT